MLSRGISISACLYEIDVIIRRLKNYPIRTFQSVDIKDNNNKLMPCGSMKLVSNK